MNSKYKMFLNYMHNELHITKEDIRNWVVEAVTPIAENHIKHQLSQYDIDAKVRSITSGFLTRDFIIGAVAKEIGSKIEFTLSKKINS